MWYVCMLEIQNVSDFSSPFFGYYTSDIVSDIQKAFQMLQCFALTFQLSGASKPTFADI